MAAQEVLQDGASLARVAFDIHIVRRHLPSETPPDDPTRAEAHVLGERREAIQEAAIELHPAFRRRNARPLCLPASEHSPRRIDESKHMTGGQRPDESEAGNVG